MLVWESTNIACNSNLYWQKRSPVPSMGHTMERNSATAAIQSFNGGTKKEGEATATFKHVISTTWSKHINMFTLLSAITYTQAVTEAKQESDLKLTIDTPYLALTGELWCVCCYRYNGTARTAFSKIIGHRLVLSWLTHRNTLPCFLLSCIVSCGAKKKPLAVTCLRNVCVCVCVCGGGGGGGGGGIHI